MTEDEKNDLVSELIEFTSYVLMRINDDSFSFPEEWKNNIGFAFGIKGAGRRSSNETKMRDIEIATQFHEYKYSIKTISSGKGIEKKPEIDKYAFELAEKYNIGDYKKVYSMHTEYKQIAQRNAVIKYGEAARLSYKRLKLLGKDINEKHLEFLEMVDRTWFPSSLEDEIRRWIRSGEDIFLL